MPQSVIAEEAEVQRFYEDLHSTQQNFKSSEWILFEVVGHR